MSTMIYYNTDVKKLCDSTGSPVNIIPELSYGEKPLWSVALLHADGSEMIPQGVTSFRAAVAFDFDASTLVQCRTLPEDIFVEGNVVKVHLNAGTKAFLDAVSGKESTKAYFDLSGFDHNGDKIFYVIFRINARMVLDPEMDENLPIEVENDYLTGTQIYAILRAEDEYQFNSAPEGEGHGTQSSSDLYYRKRNRALQGEWSDWIRLPDPVIGNYENATSESDGLMSASDKSKLDGLSAGTLSVSDAGEYFSSGTVEDVLQEAGSLLQEIESRQQETDSVLQEVNSSLQGVEQLLQEI